MKRYNIILMTMCVISIICLCSCTSNAKNTIEAKSMEDCVAYEISQIDNINEYSDEEIKVISVIIRTKLSKNSINYNFDIKNINEHIKDLTSQTRGEVLVDGENLANVSYSTSKPEEIWHENIKKSKILKYMMNNGISLSSVSNVKTNNNEDGTLNSLQIGGKDIPYSELEQNFNFKSNSIIDIKNNFTSVDVYGKIKIDENCLYLYNLKASNSINYKQLLNHYYNNYDLKTM